MSLSIRFSLFILNSIWLTGILIMFLVPYSDIFKLFYPVFDLLSSRVCHQLPEKLIYFNNLHTLVCARCSGIYAGSFLASVYILISANKPNIRFNILLFSAFPLFTDVILYSTGIYNYFHPIAFFTGALFGTICFFYIFQGLNLLVTETKSRKYN